eukprot:m.264550 g.264550  ORF g.264550 m.264550 type:complete len:227 (-) comp27935_c0_seq1:98-778(-)
MALNDAEVRKQIDHMVQFIRQEAKEKAEEIDVKAEEEFNIEKGRIVQQEKLKIMHQFERKEKQVEVQKKIQYSNELNQARLDVLKAQDEHLKKIFSEAESRIEKIAQDKSKYKGLLEKLLIQGLLAMLEETVHLRVRKGDLALIKSVFDNAKKEYTAQTGKTVAFELDEQDFLPESSGGGVELSTPNGKIKIVNTLENRLRLATEQTLPAIRNILFGVSGSRAHFN